MFYQGQKQFFEQGTAAFEIKGSSAKRAADEKDQKIARLEAKLRLKDEVVAELLADHVQLKKELGDL
jgi:hypothetical protein